MRGDNSIRQFVVCNLWFNKPDGQKLKTQKNVIVSIYNQKATIITAPEDVLPDQNDVMLWRHWAELCFDFPAPPCTIANEEEFSSYFIDHSLSKQGIEDGITTPGV